MDRGVRIRTQTERCACPECGRVYTAIPDWVCACGSKLLPYPNGLEIICGTCQSPRHGGFDRCADCDDMIEREGIAT